MTDSLDIADVTRRTGLSSRALRFNEALGFVREWLILLEPFTKVATKEMWDSAVNMYADMDKWPVKVDPGFDKSVWDFIQQASKIAREAGHDIGPLPAWK